MIFRTPLASFLAVCGLLFTPASQAQNALRDLPDPAVEAQLAAFKLLPGAKIQLFASDPMISKPVQMNWDAEGRLWLVSSGLYPHIEPSAEENDRVLVLEDLDGNGVADKVTTFATGLHIPTAVIPGDGGAYVANSTELLFLRDTNGDLQADERRVLLSGFGTEDTHHLLHTFRHGPDGKLYFSQSIYIHSHIETPHGIRRLMGGGIWHFRPETQRLEVLAKGLINPWGFEFDDWGQSFATDGAGGEGVNFIFPRSVFVTSPGASRIVSGMTPGHPKLCGLEIVSGLHAPEDLRGTFLTPDFRGHRVNIFELSPDGSSYRARQREDLVTSTHRAFRPIDVRMGPDGAIYVADWYNPIIQHGEVDFRDPRRDHTRGRIWRITFPGRPLDEKPGFARASIPELLEILKSPIRWNRDFARRTLRDRDPAEVLPALATWSASLTGDDHLREALWAYQTLNDFSPALFDRLLASPDPRARAMALRVLYHRHQDHPGTDAILARAVRDPHPQVRLWAISTLAQRPSASSVALALQTLDQPVDASIDFALWSLVREHRDHWVPALEKGDLELSAHTSHLLFAAKALGERVGFDQIFAALEGETLDSPQQLAAIELICQAGTPSDLSRLFRQAVVPGGRLGSARQSVLDSLLASYDRRQVKPEGDLSHLSILLAKPDAGPLPVAARLAGRWKLHAAKPELVRLLHDPAQPQAICQAAAEGLRLLGGQDTSASLLQVLQESPNPNARGALIGELARVSPRDAASAAVELLQQSPDGRDPFGIFEIFTRTPQAAAALAAALKGHQLPEAIAVTGLQRASSAGKPLPALQSAISEAGGLKSIGFQLSPEEKDALVQRVNSEGNAALGELIYRRPALQCVVCHAIGNVGGLIGPDLVSIGASAPVDYLIDSLLEPSVKIKEGYHTTLITLRSGENYAGGLVSESPEEIVLRDALGNLHSLRPADIASKQISPVSLMPPGLTASLRQDEFIHLVRFLSELGKEGPFKMQPTLQIRHWQALQPHDRVRDDIGHYGPAIFAENFSGYQWLPQGSLVNGSLPVAELPLQAGRGRDRWGVARFNTASLPDQPSALRFTDSSNLRLFRGEKEIALPASGPALIPWLDPVAGESFTLAINRAHREAPVSLEIVPDTAPAPALAPQSGPVPAPAASQEPATVSQPAPASPPGS